MVPPRSDGPQFLVRSVVAALLVAVVGGAFLAFFRYHSWFAGRPGVVERRGAVRSLFEARLSLPAPDTDGDGLVDWYETAVGLDPKSSASRTTVYAMCDHRLIYQGERTRLRLRMQFHDYRDVRWPVDFKAIVTAPKPILQEAENDAGPTTGPLTVAATADGNLEFDVLLTDGEFDPGISVKNAVTGTELGTGSPALIYCAGWRLPVVPSHLEMRPPEQIFNANRGSYTPDFAVPVIYGAPLPQPPQPHLVWKPLPGSVRYVVEVARVDAPDAWRAYTILDDNSASYLEIPLLERLIFPRYAGALFYRVVPTAANRPR